VPPLLVADAADDQVMRLLVHAPSDQPAALLDQLLAGFARPVGHGPGEHEEATIPSQFRCWRAEWQIVWRGKCLLAWRGLRWAKPREAVQHAQQIRGFVRVENAVLEHAGKAAIEQIDDRVMQVDQIALQPVLQELSLGLVDCSVCDHPCRQAHQRIGGAPIHSRLVEETALLEFAV